MNLSWISLIKTDLPPEYNAKADKILKEIHEAQQKAYQAQEQAQLVKKQYLRKICKNSVKVTFMDNTEYKEICEDKTQLKLQAKIDKKLEQLVTTHLPKKRGTIIAIVST